MDKRQKQVFRLVTLLPAFPAVASGTRGEQVLRLTAAGPLPDLTGFPMKLVAALLPAQDGKRCPNCQHRLFVSILQHFEIIVNCKYNYLLNTRQQISRTLTSTAEFVIIKLFFIMFEIIVRNIVSSTYTFLSKFPFVFNYTVFFVRPLCIENLQKDRSKN